MKKIVFSNFYMFFTAFFAFTTYMQQVVLANSTVNEIQTTQTQKQHPLNLNLFVINSLEDNFLLVSLSDIYDYNSSEIIIPGNKKEGFVKRQYKIDASYRKNFLNKTGISEADTLYIYHYPSGKSISLPVKNLNVVAHLNIYSSLSEAPFPDYYYMLGFEIPPKTLVSLKEDIINCFVYIGQENPFSQQPLTPLSWHKINVTSFPITTTIQDEKILVEWPEYINLTIGNTYLSETNDLQYYLQERMDRNGQLNGRRLLVMNAKTKQIILDKFFYEQESSAPAALNGEHQYDDVFQWAGKLFKNKPTVTFGFIWVSFGCPSIWVTETDEYMPINCDNRH